MANALDLQQCVTMACMLDVIAPKPGNVHRGADFADATFLDFAASAVAIGPVIARAAQQPLGRTILQAVEATRYVTKTNTNLGIILLLAPLAAVADSVHPEQAIRDLLHATTIDDARDTYRAIRLAAAGGLGEVDHGDVNREETEPLDLLQAMALARHRDRIADLYVTDFRLLFDTILPRLIEHCQASGVIHGLIASHVALLASHPDTLIVRKCGPEIAQQASDRAARISAPVGTETWQDELRDLDFWLRADGHRRNPGTTADLLTAAMFVGLYRQRIMI